MGKKLMKVLDSKQCPQCCLFRELIENWDGTQDFDTGVWHRRPWRSLLAPDLESWRAMKPEYRALPLEHEHNYHRRKKLEKVLLWRVPELPRRPAKAGAGPEPEAEPEPEPEPEEPVGTTTSGSAALVPMTLLLLSTVAVFK
eukprot:SAG11_NODE_5029_length_1686_cov_0.760555_3_plen_142_part_00